MRNVSGLILCACAACPGLNAAAADNGAKAKVLIIGIDGLRADALRAAETPNVDRLVAEGCLSEHAQVGPDTVSGPGWSSMLTGVWSSKHAVVDNDFTAPRYDRYPHFFTRLKEVRPELVTASFVDWLPIDREIVTDDNTDLRFRHDYDDDGDTRMVAAAVKVLEQEDPDVTFFYFADVDIAGHDHGFHPAVPAYLREIEQVDGQIGALLDAVGRRPNYRDEDWLILLSTDHGGTLDGAHGRDVPKHRTIPYIVSGRGAARGAIHPVPNVVDVPVTAMAHVGVPVQPEWGMDGRVSGMPGRTQFESNLLFNGDAEYGIGPVAPERNHGAAGWINAGGVRVMQYDAPDGFPSGDSPGPEDRGGSFFAGAGERDGDMSQTVSVADIGYAIDRGSVRYALSGWFGGFAEQRDLATLAVRFLDDRGGVLGANSIGPVTLEDRRSEIGGAGEALTGLLQRQTSGGVPIGTRLIEVVLEAEVGEGGNDGYADNLSLVLQRR